MVTLTPQGTLGRRQGDPHCDLACLIAREYQVVGYYVPECSPSLPFAPSECHVTSWGLGNEPSGSLTPPGRLGGVVG